MFNSRASHCGFCIRRLSLVTLAWVALSPGLVTKVCFAETLVIESSDVFKLMTFNIRYDNARDGKDAWDNRVDAVVDLLSKQDLIGLQEVTSGQLKTLVARLPEFDFYGVGRDDGRSRGEHTPIGIRRTRFAALERGTFWLSDDPEKVGVAGWDASLPRTCTWMLVKDRFTGKKLWVANTHFDHRGSNAREESARLIKRVVNEQPVATPCVVMGDFNCLQRSAPYLVLVGDQSLKDARVLSRQAVSGPESTWNGFREIASGRIIDHIFVRGRISIEQLSTLDPKTSAGRYASDHLPVQIVVSWAQSDATEN
ncbi:MAG: endonuclease/exonuclease/phosphatase family protein [Rubripirellula sp.]|nr:endonuclease/exonuclease/phosphatase family protein [Rubripirellula sp.]